MAETAESIIVIKKKKAGHGGHHGGAWKVAYADFVTAMMSLFMVMWLMSSNDSVKKSVAEYFQDPKGTSKLEGSSRAGAGDALPLSKADMPQLKERLQEAARRLPNFKQLSKQIEISGSSEGLRIELLEQPGGTFFELGSARPTPALAEFLGLISRELGKVPNRISIEGHTDSLPYSKGGNYTNWELSADRANAARRLMQSSGIGPDQIEQVRGFADQMPRRPEHPEDPSNRRISVIVDASPGPEPIHGKDEVADTKPGDNEATPAPTSSGSADQSEKATGTGAEGAKASGPVMAEAAGARAKPKGETEAEGAGTSDKTMAKQSGVKPVGLTVAANASQGRHRRWWVF